MGYTFPVDIAFGHTNLDLDALGSLILVKKIFPGYRLVRSALIHPAAYALFNLYEGFFDFAEARDLPQEKIENIIVVDTSASERVKEYFNFIRNSSPSITVYDHHHGGPCDIPGARSVAFDTGANTSGLCKMAMEKGITLLPEEATIALAGIYADTGKLLYENTRRDDYETAAWLHDAGAHLSLVKSFLDPIKEDVQHEMLSRLLADGAVNACAMQGHRILSSYLEIDEHIPGLAPVVERILEIKNADAYFAVFFVRKNKTALVIARSQKPRIDLHELLAPYGGGGHQAAASAKIPLAGDGRSGAEFFGSLLNHLETSLSPALRARDIMTREVFTVNENLPLIDASKLMEEANHTSLPVLDDAGSLCGFLSLREIMKGRKNSQMASPVRAYMIRKVVSAGPDITMREVERLFFSHRIGHLPIVEDGKLLGIVSRADYLNCVTAE
jgi:tRNA nucleotidyltransferase (CCA-adding enzyme)